MCGCGISSVKLLSSSAEGLSWMVRACTFKEVSFGVRERSDIRSGPLGARLSYPTGTGPFRPTDRTERVDRPPQVRMELSEDQLIEAIARVISGEEPGVVLGIGDDAAVVQPGRGQTVLTTDLLVEGVHFERGGISAHDLGAKAITVNVSDIAAMAASPRYALVSLAVPADLDAAWVIELYGGMRDMCAEHALALVGGDTNRAEAVVISIAVIGEVAPGKAVTRSGARTGDAIVVTGSLGAAAGGLAVSRSSDPGSILSTSWGRALTVALAPPLPPLPEAHVLASARAPPAAPPRGGGRGEAGGRGARAGPFWRRGLRAAGDDAPGLGHSRTR